MEGNIKMVVDDKGWESKAGVNLRIDVIGGTFGISKSAFCLCRGRGIC